MEYLDIQIRSRSCFSRTMPLRPPLQSFGLTQGILGHGVQITADDCLSGRSSPQRLFPYFAFAWARRLLQSTGVGFPIWHVITGVSSARN